MLAFPRLEELVFLGFWNPDEDVCDEILRAVRLRSRSTTGVSSIKRLALGCEIIPDPLFKYFDRTLQLFVDTLEWL